MPKIPESLFQNGKCPICATALTKSNQTKEHVFPQWMLKAFDLYDEKLVLLNKTSIPYRAITVPFCQKCNGERFSALEETVKNIILSGKIKKQEQYPVVIWLIKIYLSLRNLEQRLPLDRKVSGGNMILPENFFEDQNQVMYALLQTYHPDTEFVGGYPWSLFSYKISKRAVDKFWFGDSFAWPFISIRLGDIGIVCLLTDGGGQTLALKEMYDNLKRVSLKTIQFAELAARHLSWEQQRDYIPRFTTAYGENLPVTIVNHTTVIRYRPIDIPGYHLLLQQFTGIDLGQYQLEEGAVLSTLR
ncbi:MAG: hypothetical protein JWQ66_383 [Mucilaginibacter sp.]|nr:hypothetical protein [Mucilaginibacter sp.]